MKISVAVVGVTGYSGLELMKIILRHSAMECVAVMASESTGEKSLGEVHPQLRGLTTLTCVPQDPERLAKDSLFSAHEGRNFDDQGGNHFSLAMRDVQRM